MEKQMEKQSNNELERSLSAKIIRKDLKENFLHTLQYKGRYDQTIARKYGLTETKVKALVAASINRYAEIHKEELLNESNLKEVAKTVFEETKGSLKLTEVTCTSKNLADLKSKPEKEKFDVVCDWSQISIIDSAERVENVTSKEKMTGLEKTIEEGLKTFIKNEFQGITIYTDVKNAMLSSVKQYLAGDMGVKSLSSIIVDKQKDIYDVYDVNKNDYLDRVKKEKYFEEIQKAHEDWTNLCKEQAIDYVANVDDYNKKSDTEKLKEAKKTIEKVVKPYLGKAEFTSDKRNLIAFENYRQELNELKDLELQENAQRKQIVDELASLMNSYADQKVNAPKEDNKIVDFELHKEPKQKIVYPKQSVDMVEDGFWNSPILTEQEIKEEIARRLKEQEGKVDTNEQNNQEKMFSAKSATNMISKGVYNGLRWAEEIRELSKEETDNLRESIASYYANASVSQKEIADEIDRLTQNYDTELERIRNSKYMAGEVQPTKEEQSYPIAPSVKPITSDVYEEEQSKELQQDPTWEKIKQMYDNSKKENKESSEEWERIKMVAKAEDVRLNALCEVRDGEVSYEDYKSFEQDIQDRLTETLKKYGVPEDSIVYVKQNMKTLYFQKKEFKKDSDIYTKNFADLLVKEMKQSIIPSIDETRKNIADKFDTYVEEMGKVENGGFASKSDVLAFLDNNYTKEDKKEYWNDEEKHLTYLKELAEDTSAVDEVIEDDEISNAIYKNANQYESMVYTLNPDSLIDNTKKSTVNIGNSVLTSVEKIVNNHEKLKELYKGNDELKSTIINHIACEVVLDCVQENELNAEAFEKYVITNISSNAKETTAKQFNKKLNDVISTRVSEMYKNVAAQKEELKDRFSELLTRGLTKEEIKLEVKKYTKEDNEAAINEVIKNYNENGVVDYKAFLDAYLSETQNINPMRVSNLTREYKRNLELVKNYYKLEDVKLHDNATYEDKVKALEVGDKDAVKHMADFVRYLRMNHPKQIDNYVKLKKSLPFDAEQKMKEDQKFLAKEILAHYNNLRDQLTLDEKGASSLANYDYRKHYRFLRRKDVGVERGNFGKRAGAFFARHWYKLASVGLLGYLAVSAMLFVPATTSFIGFIGGAALTYGVGAVLNSVLLGKVPFLKDIIRNRRLAYGLSKREVERSTRRVDELMNGRHVGLGFILKKVFTFGRYNKYGSVTERLDEANRLLDKMESMTIKNAKQAKRTYKRIQKLLKAKGDGVLETDNGTGIKYTSKFAKKIAKRLGIDENTNNIEVTDKDYVDMFLNNDANTLHYDSTVKYNKGKVLGIFGKTRSVGYAIERLENHDKYITRMSNVWKITDENGNISYKKCRKNTEPVLRKGESCEQLSVIDNYVDDFNNLVDEGKAIVSSTRVLLAKAQKSYAANLRRAKNHMPEEELAQLKYEYDVNKKATHAAMKSRREVNAEIRAEYHGIKNDRRAASRAYSEDYEEENAGDKTNMSKKFEFESINFDTMTEQQKKEEAYKEVFIGGEKEREALERIRNLTSTKEKVKVINEVIAKREEKMDKVMATIQTIDHLLGKNNDLVSVFEEQLDVEDKKSKGLTKEEIEKLKKIRQHNVNQVVEYFRRNQKLVKADRHIKNSITEDVLRKAGINLEEEPEF